MSLATTTAVRLAAGSAAASVTLLGTALGFAVHWLVVCLLSAAIYWAVSLAVFRRWHGRRPANPGTLFIAFFLVALGACGILVESHAFAQHEPFFSAPIQMLFLLFFFLFSDSRYAPRWTRWLLILYVFAQIGTFIPSQPNRAQSGQFALPTAPGVVGAMQVASDVISLTFLFVGIALQVYFRYRDRAKRGAPPAIQRGTLLVLGTILALASLLALVASGLFVSASVAAGAADAPGLLLVRTCFYLVLTLVPVAGGFALMRGQRYDLDALTNRLLVYVPLTACLMLIYAVCVGGLLVFFPGFAHFRSFAYVYIPFFILITLAQVAAFQPLREYIQDAVDRRFFRRRYDAARVLAALRKPPRERTPLEQSCKQLVTGIQKAMQCEAVTLWLRSAPANTTRNTPPWASAIFSTDADTRQAHSQTRSTEQAGDAFRLRRQAGTAIADASAPLTLDIAPDDPIRLPLLRAASLIDLDRLSGSPTASALQARGTSLALPLASDGKLVGAIALDVAASTVPYTVDERELLATLADSVAPALAAELLEHEQNVQVRERERVEQELQTARRIQKALLPKAVPTLDGWQLATLYQPAREVGGDFYDFLTLPDGRLGLVLGDVTDKGMPAALVMATTRSMLRAVGAQHGSSPGQVLAQVNELLCPDLPASMFVTCFYAILNPATGHVRYANAGQDVPYLRHADGSVCELRATGMPLGLMPGMAYDEQETLLAPGESVLFYSDGLVEAHNPEREMFGFPRLMSLLGNHADGSPPIVFLLHELASFTGAEWEQEDDITLVSLHRLPQSDDGEAHAESAPQRIAEPVVAPALSTP